MVFPPLHARPRSMWGLGNEMEGSGENPVIWRTVNEIARVAKSEDPNHPTMTIIAEAGGRKISQFMSLCPDVDVLGINSYAGLPTLPKRLADAGLERPYVITEFGPPGPWEGAQDGLGGVRRTDEHRESQRLPRQLLRFNIRSKRAMPWLLCLPLGPQAGGNSHLVRDVPSLGRTAGSGRRDDLCLDRSVACNRAPEINAISTEARDAELTQGSRFTAKLDASDPEGDPLVVRWEVRSENADLRQGGDRETEPPAHPECFVEAKGLDATFQAPPRSGAYRLFAYLYDGKGGAACANVPFAVGPR